MQANFSRSLTMGVTTLPRWATTSQCWTGGTRDEKKMCACIQEIREWYVMAFPGPNATLEFNQKLQRGWGLTAATLPDGTPDYCDRARRLKQSLVLVRSAQRPPPTNYEVQEPKPRYYEDPRLKAYLAQYRP